MLQIWGSEYGFYFLSSDITEKMVGSIQKSRRSFLLLDLGMLYVFDCFRKIRINLVTEFAFFCLFFRYSPVPYGLSYSILSVLFAF